MIKKLLLTFCFVTLITITFNGTTYAAQEGETIVTSEELSNTIIILNNLYKDGVLTEEEYLNAKSAILNPASVSDGKIEKKSKQLTAVERKRLKEAKVKAEKELKNMENEAKREAIAEEKERIKETKTEACLEAENFGLSDETPRGCQLIKIGNVLKKITSPVGDALPLLKKN